MQPEIIQATKELALILLSGGMTFLITFKINSTQYKRERIINIERKEEEIILDAVKFISTHQDRLRQLITTGDYANFSEFLDADYFPTLFLISFKLKRLQDENIWKKFEDLYARIFAFTSLVQSSSNPTAELFDREEFKIVGRLQREFTDLCVNYLKLRR